VQAEQIYRGPGSGLPDQAGHVISHAFGAIPLSSNISFGGIAPFGLHEVICDHDTGVSSILAWYLAQIDQGKPEEKAARIPVFWIRQRRAIDQDGLYHLSLPMLANAGFQSLMMVVWSKVMEQHRREIMTATVLGVAGKLQREDGVTHVIADKLVDLTGMLQGLTDNTKIARSNNSHPRNLRWASGLDSLSQPNTSQSQKIPNLKIDSHDFH
jgi:hypothetical protein